MADNCPEPVSPPAGLCAPPTAATGEATEVPGAALSEASSAERLLGGLLYGLSIPERLLRSAVGLTAGTAREIAELVVPQAFQDSKSYEVAVRNSLSFLVANIGTLGAEPAPAAAAEAAGLTAVTGLPVASGAVADTASAGATGAGGTGRPGGPGGDPLRYVARKAAGNFVDIAGLATLHVSPLWVLAIVSDVAYGTRTYVSELAQELQRQGLIDDSSTIHRVDDLLDAIKQASGTAASSFDTPPLSLEELQLSVLQTRAALADVDPTQLIPEAEISRYWQEMQRVARQEGASLLGVSAAVAMQTVETIRDMSHGTLTGLFVAGKIINRNVFGHYIGSLQRIGEQGLWSTVRNTYEPYVDLAWGNFTSSRRTWTEQVLHPGHMMRAWNKVQDWFRRS